jgi:hypothetical protein
VAALRNDSVSLTEPTELICEVESALTAADVTAEETRREGIDPVLRDARWEADYGRVKAERDRLAAELAETYPQIVAKLVDLLNRVAYCERECERIAGTAPSGERRRLLGPELHAKGLTRFTRDTPSFTRDLRLPDWEQPATTSWPPQRAREMLTFPLYAHKDRYSANWWRAR